jgi:chromosomal replication initiation ATPase DnaA
MRAPSDILTPDRVACALLRALDEAGHGALVRSVSEHYGIRHPETLLGRSRHARIAFARHHLAWELKELGYSFPEVGRALGRDHTTIMASCRTFERACGIVSAVAPAAAPSGATLGKAVA